MNRTVDASVISLYRKYCRKLLPVQTGMNPSLKRLDTIRAVLFDVYGTLVISSSGDVGTAVTDSQIAGFREIFRNETNHELPSAADVDSLLTAEIRKSHTESRASGVASYPEVEIRSLWKKILVTLNRSFNCNLPSDDKSASNIALLYELSKNNVWPMPGAAGIIRSLSSSGFILGIISNAQYYTPQMMMHFFPEEFAMIPESNCIWSFTEGRGKPDRELFNKFLNKNPHYSPDSILYVGNDMLNDIYTASECGMKTALFAGDKRSLRLRNKDSRILNLKPDVVLTSLDQLETVLGTEYAERVSSGYQQEIL